MLKCQAFMPPIAILERQANKSAGHLKLANCENFSIQESMHPNVASAFSLPSDDVIGKKFAELAIKGDLGYITGKV